MEEDGPVFDQNRLFLTFVAALQYLVLNKKSHDQM